MYFGKPAMTDYWPWLTAKGFADSKREHIAHYLKNKNLGAFFKNV